LSSGPSSHTVFGAFDYRFFGLTLRFETGEAFDAFARPEPAAKVTDETLWATTVFDHELRHFHDFLLSPHSANIFRLRLLAMMKGYDFLIGAYNEGSALENRCIPIPLTRWLRRHPTNRAADIRLWSRSRRSPNGVPWAPVPVPYVQPADEFDCDDELAASAFITAKAYEAIARYSRGFATQDQNALRATDVFELSALLLQGYAARMLLGEHAMGEFFARIASNARYGRPLNLLERAFGEFGHTRWDAALMAVTWSLLGRSLGSSHDEAAESHACPAYRLTFLLDLFRRDGIPPAGTGCKLLFARWDSALGAVPLAEGLEREVSANESAQVTYDCWAATQVEEMRPLSSVFASYADAHKHAVRSFLANPDDYVRPEAYLEGLDRLPAPVIRLISGRFGFQLGDGEGGLTVLRAVADPTSPSGYAGVDYLLPHRDGTVDGWQCYKLAQMLAYVDYHFQPFERSDDSIVLAGEQVRADPATFPPFNVM
jgi:hypothetical protein